MPDDSLLFISGLFGARGPTSWRACAVSSDNRGSSMPGRPVSHETPSRRHRGYWNDPENLTRELRAFAAAQGEPSRMPTEAELRKGGRVDIGSAVRRCGGWERSAGVAGLVLTSIARPRSIYLTYCIDLKPGAILKPHKYWNEFDNLRDELMAFVRQKNTSDSGENDSGKRLNSAEGPGMVPSTSELEQAGRSDLVRAIHKHGGFEAVARRLDLKFRYHSGGYWRKFENVERVRLSPSSLTDAALMRPLHLTLSGNPSDSLVARLLILLGIGNSVAYKSVQLTGVDATVAGHIAAWPSWFAACHYTNSRGQARGSEKAWPG
jgi:hypothetical protein